MNGESSATEIATEFSTECATLGGGCFWCLDAVFERLRGVVEVVSGYAGGRVNNPSYQAVCDGDTGHAEVVQIRFRPDQISYRELLDVFFAIHDPTTPNRQGNDVGTQYRSVIFTHSDDQAKTARQVITELKAAATFAKPVVTQVLPVPTFWPAETYHQGYFARNDRQPYCQIVVGPKVAKFRDKFRGHLKHGS
jgi:peptide-methionine (S)-S-oxide reductase